MDLAIGMFSFHSGEYYYNRWFATSEKKIKRLELYINKVKAEGEALLSEIMTHEELDEFEKFHEEFKELHKEMLNRMADKHLGTESEESFLDYCMMLMGCFLKYVKANKKGWKSESKHFKKTI